MSYNKYRAKAVFIDGHKFDSVKEANRYQELRILQLAGEISELELHPKFVLIPSFRDSDGKTERAATYKADFAYKSKGKYIVEDVKSVVTRQTKDYVLRRKLLKTKYPHIHFREVA